MSVQPYYDPLCHHRPSRTARSVHLSLQHIQPILDTLLLDAVLISLQCTQHIHAHGTVTNAAMVDIVHRNNLHIRLIYTETRNFILDDVVLNALLIHKDLPDADTVVIDGSVILIGTIF